MPAESFHALAQLFLRTTLPGKSNCYSSFQRRKLKSGKSKQPASSWQGTEPGCLCCCPGHPCYQGLQGTKKNANGPAAWHQGKVWERATWRMRLVWEIRAPPIIPMKKLTPWEKQAAFKPWFLDSSACQNPWRMLWNIQSPSHILDQLNYSLQGEMLASVCGCPQAADVFRDCCSQVSFRGGVAHWHSTTSLLSKDINFYRKTMKTVFL